MNHLSLIPAIVAATVAITGCAGNGRQIEQANVPGTTQMVAMFGPPCASETR